MNSLFRLKTIHQVSRFRVPSLFAAAFVAGSLLLAPSASRAADPAQSGWHIAKTAGDVRYRMSDEAGTPWILAKKGAVITAQARFETGTDGKITLTRDGDRIGMSPNSRILLPSVQASRKVTTVIQSVGIMLYKVKRRARALLVGGTPARRFEVRTPYLVTMVKGTTFAISANSSGAAVNLIEGILDVSTPAGNVVTQILGGQIAAVAQATKGAISVIKTNGTGHKIFRSQRTIEAKAKSGNAPSGKSFQVAKLSAPSNNSLAVKKLSVTRGDGPKVIGSRGQGTKKTILSSLAAVAVGDGNTGQGAAKSIGGDSAKAQSPAKVTVVALAATNRQVKAISNDGVGQAGNAGKSATNGKGAGKGKAKLGNLSSGSSNRAAAPSVSPSSSGGSPTVAPSAPTVSAPTVSAPAVSVPTVSAPTVSVPTVSAPTISVPTVSIPIVSVSLPPQANGGGSIKVKTNKGKSGK